MTPKQELIYNYIKQNPSITNRELFTFLGTDPRDVYKHIGVLKTLGLVKVKYKDNMARLFARNKK